MVPRMLNWRLDLIKTARSVTVTTTSKITGPMIGAVTAKTAEPDPNSDVKSSLVLRISNWPYNIKSNRS